MFANSIRPQGTQRKYADDPQIFPVPIPTVLMHPILRSKRKEKRSRQQKESTLLEKYAMLKLKDKNSLEVGMPRVFIFYAPPAYT